MRRTLIVANRTAWAHERLAAARAGAHGLQILSLPQVVARLAGGFLQPVPSDTLLALVAEALTKLDLAELSAIADLPGTSRAVTRTIRKAWSSDLNLEELEDGSVRLHELATIERFVQDRLPPSMRTPRQLAETALARMAHATAILGSVRIRGVLDPEPCWRAVLEALAGMVEFDWEVAPGPEIDLAWLERAGARLVTSPSSNPTQHIAACADPRHEAIEALRWARDLIASGCARPGDIALTAASPFDWDEDLETEAEAGDLPVYFAAGRRALSTFPGQQAAALADLLIRGLTRSRAVRAFRLCASSGPSLQGLPRGWHRVLPRDAILHRPEDWGRALDQAAETGFVDDVDPRPTVLSVIEFVDGGADNARAAGEALLSGMAHALWEQALVRAPAEALPTTLGELRLPEDGDPNNSILWIGAHDLVATPRRFVRLLGMTSRGWPRVGGEDPILPDHILPARMLEPVPLAARDRRALDCIRAGTGDEVVYTLARRDRLGGEQGESPLLPVDVPRQTLLRARVPNHAMSEADRLAARLGEFERQPRAIAAQACSENRRSLTLTPHDGLVRPDHPAIKRALDRLHSATSLRRLLRDPLGFTWRYALGWRELEKTEIPLALDPKDFGNLVHRILELAVDTLEAGSGFGTADAGEIRAAVQRATSDVAEAWALEAPLPPRTVWERVLAEGAELARRALAADPEPLTDQASWVEIAFGGSPGAAAQDRLPWDPTAAVELPGIAMRIAGRIDRLDLSGDRRSARVTDYKTGRVPKEVDSWVLNGGAELQRCLYAAAARQLLGEPDLESRLLYPRDGGGIAPLDDVVGTLDILTVYLGIAREHLLAGSAVPGIDTGDTFDECAIALPANAPGLYLRRKEQASRERLGELCELWEHP